MYTGHVAVALGARGLRRDVPLLVLVLAAQGCDWVELAARLFVPRHVAEVSAHAYPWLLVSAVTAAGVVWLWKRSAGAALTVCLVYLSHPLADYVTGYKPLWIGGPAFGFRLIERPALDFVVQSLVCLVGFALYVRSLPAVRRREAAVALPLAALLVLQGLSDLTLEMRHRRGRGLLRTVAPSDTPALPSADGACLTRLVAQRS